MLRYQCSKFKVTGYRGNMKTVRKTEYENQPVHAKNKSKTKVTRVKISK